MVELLSIETRFISFTLILCFFKKFEIVEIWGVHLMLARSLHNNMCKPLSMHYMQGFLICKQVFNATKVLSPISYSIELSLLYQNAH